MCTLVCHTVTTINMYFDVVPHAVQIDVRCNEMKTKDNVTCNIVASVMYKVDPKMIEKAFYGLEDVVEQLSSYVQDTIRAGVAKLDLDKLCVTVPASASHSGVPHMST